MYLGKIATRKATMELVHQDLITVPSFMPGGTERFLLGDVILPMNAPIK